MGLLGGVSGGLVSQDTARPAALSTGLDEAALELAALGLRRRRGLEAWSGDEGGRDALWRGHPSEEPVAIALEPDGDVADTRRHDALGVIQSGEVRGDYDLGEARLGRRHAKHPPRQLVGRRGGEAVAEAGGRREALPERG